jgi:hypothetical protein
MLEGCLEKHLTPWFRQLASHDIIYTARPCYIFIIIIIRPEVGLDTRGEQTLQAIRDLSRQIDSTIDLQIHRVITGILRAW